MLPIKITETRGKPAFWLAFHESAKEKRRVDSAESASLKPAHVETISLVTSALAVTHGGYLPGSRTPCSGSSHIPVNGASK